MAIEGVSGAGPEWLYRNRRMWLAGLVAAVLFVGCWIGLGGSNPSAVAVPRFLPPPAAATAATATPRTGLLPDCAQVLPGSVDPAALLAQPSGSVAVHPVVGTPSPSVALMARTSCTYHRAGVKGNQTLGQVNLSAFADPAAAEAQRQRNLAAEQSGPGVSAAPIALGAAHSTLIASPTGTVLMTAYDRYTVTTTLPHGLFPPDEERDVVIDLTRRALATTLVPAPAPAPAPAAGHVPALAQR